MKRYDILVIGSGPAGEKAAIQAAKLGKKAVIIEKEPYLGGTGLRTGTLPSKTLREAALYIASLRQRVIHGFYYTIGRDVTLQELMHRKDTVIQRQMEVIADHLTKNNIDVVYGKASFKDEHTLTVQNAERDVDYCGDVIVVATGSKPHHPDGLDFDGRHIYDSDSILKLDAIPERLTILGGGVIGCEYASIFSCLGVKVTLIEKRDRLLHFIDGEIVNSLSYWMRHSGIVLRLNEKVVDVSIEGPERVAAHMESGKTVISEKLLYTMGRVGNTADLNIQSIGIEPTPRGLIPVNEFFGTTVPSVFAIGDVIGHPALAATAMEQGRKVVCQAFLDECHLSAYPVHIPTGIYTIPEISMVGETEESLTGKGIPYEAGQAFFNEVARGQIIGDIHGMLKLLFHRKTRKLLGVHIIGERATDLIHIGQAILSCGGTIDYFVDAVFNFPTLSDAYKVAALNGINRL